MTSFAPTAEQTQALRLFRTGASLAIEAGAGTGKTATLALLAEDAHGRRRRGQYIAFNRAIVNEGRSRFPDSVKCHTAHSLAFRAVGRYYSERLDRSSRMKSMEIAERLRIEPIELDVAGERKLLSRSYLAGLVMRAVGRFCQSADPEPEARHVPLIKGIDVPPFVNGERNYVNQRAVAAQLVPYMRRAWDDIVRLDGALRFDHDHYLKIWQLGLNPQNPQGPRRPPRIGADYILFDECQDANPVILSIVAAQTHAQVVWVGDSQQQIYAFTGAVNALERIRERGTATTFLTKSFRFGPAIADQANTILAVIPGAELRLQGHDEIGSRIVELSEPRAILTRTNAAAVRSVLSALDAGRSPHLVGGGTEIIRFAEAALALMNGEPTSHPELACFLDWDEVLRYVSDDEQGSDLRLMVKLIEDFGVQSILDGLSRGSREEDADLIVSTAHKSKGREWDSVQLAGDFPEEAGKAGADELRLLYVACTRARLELDITQVGILAAGVLEALEADAAPVVPAPDAASEEAEPAVDEAHSPRAAGEAEAPSGFMLGQLQEFGRCRVEGMTLGQIIELADTLGINAHDLRLLDGFVVVRQSAEARS